MIRLFNKINILINIMFILSLFVFLGCENRYSKYYTDLTGGKNALKDPNFISSNEPRLIQSSDINNDMKRMVEDGYFPIGYSSFQSTPADGNEAVRHAKKIHAEIVILYSKYLYTESGTRVSRYSVSGTYGNIPQICEVHYNNPIYYYYATFWVKVKSPMLSIK